MMRRRTFAGLLGTGMALPAMPQASNKTSKPSRTALLTEGGAAHVNFYLEALAKAPEAGSVSLCDPSGESFADAQKILGAKLTGTYGNAQELLRKERPFLALVSMEAVNSPPVIDAALDSGCHVMAEKPACVRVDDFERLNQKAKARHLHLMLALANRVDPFFVEARRIVREGKIGNVYGMELHLVADQTRLTSLAYHKSWFAQKARAGGGHLIWLGIHWLDLAMFITGSAIRMVAGFTTNAGGQPLDVEDSAALALEMENGSLGTLVSGYYLDKGYHSHLKIWGSRGWLRVQKHPEAPLEWYSTLEAAPQVRRWEPPQRDLAAPYSMFVRAVVRAALGLELPPLTGDESLVALKTVFACYQAAATGRTQRIS